MDKFQSLHSAGCVCGREGGLGDRNKVQEVEQRELRPESAADSLGLQQGMPKYNENRRMFNCMSHKVKRPVKTESGDQA